MKPRFIPAIVFGIFAAFGANISIAQNAPAALNLKENGVLPLEFNPANNANIRRKLLSNRTIRAMFQNVLPKWIENHCADGPIAVPKCANPRQFTINDMFADIEMAQVNLDDDNVDDLVLMFGRKTGLSFSNTEATTHLRFYKGVRYGYAPFGQIDMPNIASIYIDEYNPRQTGRDLLFLANEDEGEPKYLIEKMSLDTMRGHYTKVDRLKEAEAACKAWDGYKFIKLLSQDRDVFKKFIGPNMWVGEKSANGNSGPQRQVSTKDYDELQFSYYNGLWFKSGLEGAAIPEHFKVNVHKDNTNALLVRFQAAEIDAKSGEISHSFGPIRELEFTPNGTNGCWELYSSMAIVE